MKRGKKYLTASKKVDKQKTYPLAEALSLVKSMAFAKFDETVEISVRLNLKKSQTIRDTLVLPHQFGAQKRILVFAKGEKATEAKNAGAAYVGDTDLVEKIRGGWVDFDVAIATPDMMKEVGRLGPVLGRRGLMPNPKTKTVTFEVADAIHELNKGRSEFRSDKSGVVHFAVGKTSMSEPDLLENILLVSDEINMKKPADVKGDYLKSFSVASTMGPGVKVDLKDFM